MLVLSRLVNQSINIGDDITIVVVSIKGNKVRLGIKAPKAVTILRPEARKRTDATNTDRN